MNDASRRLLLVTATTLVTGFLFLLAVSVFRFPVSDVLSTFQWQWIFRDAMVGFVDAVPALQAFAVALTFSLLINVTEIRVNRGEVPSFFSLVNGPIVFLLVMTVIYGLLIGVAEPVLVTERDELVERTEMAEGFKEQAELHIEEGKYGLAITELRHYLAINPGDREGVEMLGETLEAAESREDVDPSSGTSTILPISERTEMTATDSVALAERYLEDENYISALYYARLARELDPNRDDAERIVGLSLEHLEQAELSVAERETRRLFDLKREGYRAFQQGRYLDAYYLFLSLAEEYPGDPDVRVYLPRIRAALQEQAFFLEEILPIIALTGATRLTFLNRPEEPGREYLHIDKIIGSSSGVYAIGVEALGLEEDGTLRYHLAAPYGKLRDGTLMMRAVSETDPNEAVEPLYFAGSRPQAIAHTIALSAPQRDLMVIAKANASLRSATLGELFRMTTVLDRYGYGARRSQAEILRRLNEPFGFIVFVLLLIGAGWQLRSRYVSRPPIVALAVVPFFPFVLYYVFEFYRYAFQIVSRHLLLHVGMAGAVGAVIGLQAVLLASVLFVVATRVAE